MRMLDSRNKTSSRTPIAPSNHQKNRNPNIEVRNQQESNRIPIAENPKLVIRIRIVWNIGHFGHLDLFRISVLKLRVPIANLLDVGLIRYAQLLHGAPRQNANDLLPIPCRAAQVGQRLDGIGVSLSDVVNQFAREPGAARLLLRDGDLLGNFRYRAGHQTQTFASAVWLCFQNRRHPGAGSIFRRPRDVFEIGRARPGPRRSGTMSSVKISSGASVVS